MTIDIDWKNSVIPKAAEVIRSFKTPVTARQLYYELITLRVLPSYSEGKGKKTANERNNDVYHELARKCAKARREGYGPKKEFSFPRLSDNTRQLYNTYFEKDVPSALDDLLLNYRRDRQEGQENYIYLGVEKETLRAGVLSWAEPLGFPVIALKGDPSQDYRDRVKRHIYTNCARSDRIPHLIYAGDFDPKGEQILQSFCNDVDIFKLNIDFEREFTFNVHRVAVLEDQIIPMGLPTSIDAKEKDTNLPKFTKRHKDFFDEHFNGRALQIETEAIHADTLEKLFWEGIKPLWDEGAYKAVLRQELKDRTQLRLTVETEKTTPLGMEFSELDFEVEEEE
jgi:hypothetical protein